MQRGHTNIPDKGRPEPGEKSVTLCANCVPSTVLAAFCALFPRLRIGSQHRFFKKKKNFFFSLTK